MNDIKISKIMMILFAVVFCFGPVGLADPIGTAFTYQGRLIDSNNAADGLYDFQFKLYDANGGGNKLGQDVNMPEIDVIDGYFTTELDFGSAFDGNNRWLEIGVRPGVQSDPCAYSLLSPRQKVTPTPYALYAQNSGSGGLLPSGVIVMWSGTIATIPAGWALCDGTNGTPDLRDRFLVGARQDSAGVANTNVTGTLTQQGGSTSHSHGASVSNNTGIIYGVDIGGYWEIPSNNHSHIVTVGSTGHLPPYYALAYIMKN